MNDRRVPSDQNKRRFLRQLTVAVGAGTLSLVTPFGVRAGYRGSSKELLDQLNATDLRDRMTTPGAPGYDSARLIYDRRTDKRPLAIVYCSNPKEVATVLSLAQENQVPFAIRSGGHGFTGRSTIEGGVLVDLSRMNRVTVSSDSRLATIEPGARTMQVLGTTTTLGKAPVTPTDGHIGLVGAALFSGQGYLSRLYGNACDNVMSAQIMLGDGKIVTASPTDHEDLFWAVRGAGDAFGVVLSMAMRLHDLPQKPIYCSITYGMKDALELMKRYQEHKWASPTPFPLGGFSIDPKTREPLLSYLIILLGSDEENRMDIEAIDKFAPPVTREVRAVTWLEAHTALPLPSDKRFYIAGRETKTQDDVSMNLMLEMIEAARALPPTNGELTGPIVFFFPNDEGFAKLPPSPAAYNLRGGFEIECLASWDDPRHDPQFEGWAEASAARITKAGLISKPPVIANSKVDELLTRQCFGKDYPRLVSIKRKYDPHMLFGATTVIRG